MKPFMPRKTQSQAKPDQALPGGKHFAGKKYLIIASIFLLAAACNRHAVVQPTPQQNQQNPAVNQSQPATSTPAVVPTSTPPVVKKPTTPAPLLLEMYNDTAGKFKVKYTSNFAVYSALDLKKIRLSEDVSACNLGLGFPSVCFVLKGAPYAGTNFASAAVYVRKLSNITDIGQCAKFDPNELSGGLAGGQGTGTLMINGVLFITASSTDAGAGNFYETHFNRAYYVDSCYEVDETVHSVNPGVYDPPRPVFDEASVWSALDSVRGGFSFIAPPASKIPSIKLP